MPRRSKSSRFRDRGFKLTLGTHSLLLGSSRQCDVVLHDPTVSDRHAEIITTSEGYTIRDLKSTNGVIIGTTPIERAPLDSGMRIRLGERS